jgi:hypothetical protein
MSSIKLDIVPPLHTSPRAQNCNQITSRKVLQVLENPDGYSLRRNKAASSFAKAMFRSGQETADSARSRQSRVFSGTGSGVSMACFKTSAQNASDHPKVLRPLPFDTAHSRGIFTMPLKQWE